jgi:hypothetical protein
MSDLAEAVSCLERGDCEAAHRIVQRLDSGLAWWAHGIVHMMESDESNAAYWYRRAGRTLPKAGAQRIEREIAALRERIG